MSRKIPVYLSLPEELCQRIQTLAKDSNRTRAAYIRQIIRRYLRYLEAEEHGDTSPIDWRIE